MPEPEQLGGSFSATSPRLPRQPDRAQRNPSLPDNPAALISLDSRECAEWAVCPVGISPAAPPDHAAVGAAPAVQYYRRKGFVIQGWGCGDLMHVRRIGVGRDRHHPWVSYFPLSFLIANGRANAVGGLCAVAVEAFR